MRFRFIYVFCYIFYYYFGKENRLLYQGLHYIKVFYIEVPLYHFCLLSCTQEKMAVMDEMAVE